MLLPIADLIDRAKAQIGAKSDYQFIRMAPALKLSSAKIAQWRQGDRNPDPDALAQLYELAGLDPTPALLAKHAELSKGAARKYYERLLKSVAALILALFITLPGRANATATSDQKVTQFIHYAIRRFLRITPTPCTC